MRIPVDERAPLASYPFLTVHPVRYGDLDPNNHVNNAVIGTYLEIGRTEFFDREGIRLTAEGRGISLVHVEIEFHREILYPGSVQIVSGIRRVGASRSPSTRRSSSTACATSRAPRPRRRWTRRPGARRPGTTSSAPSSPG